jgi:hypothetical protein
MSMTAAESSDSRDEAPAASAPPATGADPQGPADTIDPRRAGNRAILEETVTRYSGADRRVRDDPSYAGAERRMDA